MPLSDSESHAAGVTVCPECDTPLPESGDDCPCGFDSGALPVGVYGLKGWRWIAQKWSGGYDPGTDTLVFQIDGIRVVVTRQADYPAHIARTDEATQLSLLRATADYMLVSGPELRAWRPGFVTGLLTALGAQDIVIGSNAEFDAHFVVKGRSQDELRRVFRPELQQTLLSRFPNAAVEADGRTVTILSPGAQGAAALAELVAAFASVGWRTLRDRLLDLPDATYEPLQGPLSQDNRPFVTVSGRTSVAFLPLARGEDLHLQATAPTSRSDLAPDLDVEIPTPPEDRSDQLPPEVGPIVPRLGRVRLARRGDVVELTWQDPDPTREQLEAGIEILRVLSHGTRGPYR